MIMDNNCLEMDEEEVVIEGSELYKTLIQLGLIDFETASGEQKEIKQLDNNITKNHAVNTTETFQILTHFYHRLTTDRELNAEKIQIILFLKPLLDDHACKIQDLISGDTCSSWKKYWKWLPMIGTSVATIVSFVTKQSDHFTILLASLTSLCVYNTYSKRSSVHKLKKFVTVQNSFYCNIKKCLNILRNDFQFRKSNQKLGNMFLDFRQSQHKFFIPLLTSVIKSLEKVSLLYYKTRQRMGSLLPENKLLSLSLTSFDEESFLLNGEITYNKLKSLYYTYLLIQSETLYLLAILYSENANNSIMNISECKLSHIENSLIEPIKIFRNKLTQILNDYKAANVKLVPRKFRENKTTWQDIYIQLDLTSQKLLSSYLIVSELLNSIDNQTEEGITDEKLTEMLMNKMNEATKQIEFAKSCFDFGNLLLLKKQYMMNKTNDVNDEEENVDNYNVNPVCTTEVDTNPEILDEMFEEYIREEYLKPFCEDEDDDELTYNQKINHFLSMNYMKELKEVLIDKQKVIQRRENEAFQRKYGKLPDENNTVEDILTITQPVPPPIPDTEFKISPSVNSTKNIQTHVVDTLKTVNTIFAPKKSVISVDSLPDEEKDDTLMKFSIGNICLPQKVTFLKDEEETFTGSGEKSDEELNFNCSDQENEC